ncbi:MAG: TolC family protein, partial [Planctomycetales bacterium]
MNHPGFRRRLLATIALLCATGCHGSKQLNFDAGGRTGRGPHRTVSTQIEYPNTNVPESPESLYALEPATLSNPYQGEQWNLTLEEAVHIALANSTVIRDLGGRVVLAPDFHPSVYDPALTESNPLSGTEAALSAFDATFAASSIWARNDRAVNFFIPGLTVPLAVSEVGQFQAAISKRAATGTEFVIRNNTDYEQNNNRGNFFPSAWNTNFEMEFTHPLLQGAGTEFNRIAGPNAIPGNYGGVMLARLNTDISLVEFEMSVRDFVSDVESAYWDLVYSYRHLESRITARDSVLQIWQGVHARVRAGARGGGAADEAQARSSYYGSQSQVQESLVGTRSGGTATIPLSGYNVTLGSGGLYSREAALRSVMGLPPTDGRFIHPVDRPAYVPIAHEWSQTV